MRTPDTTALKMLALATLVAAGWLVGVYAAQQLQVTAAGSPGQHAIHARADFPPDQNGSSPGPTDPNGAVY